MFTPEMIDDFMSVDMNTVDRDELVDVSGFTFDNDAPQEQRAALVISSVKNPYCFRVGDMGVKLEFSNNALDLQTVFSNFLKRKKSGL
ncbi:MAG TPA: hypothetical protein DEQ02_04245 [Ruminococcaceae bacterium]|nr:hypothetical protein [Oscillospiraceae bacterium]